MNNAASFNTFLQNGIGLSQARQRVAITTHGYNTCRGLVDTTNEGIKEVFAVISRENRDLAVNVRVYVREQVKQRFYGAKAEFLMRLSCNSDIDAAYLTGLTTDDVDDFVRKHNKWREYKNAARTMSLPDVTVPKLTKNNWKLVRNAIREVLQRQRGTHNIPLIYYSGR